MSIREEDIDKIAEAVVKRLLSDKSDLMHWVQLVNKTTDDALMHLRLKDVANVDKVVLTGPPSQYQPSSTAQGAGNRVVFSSYTFIPDDVVENKKYPLIVLPHGGVHSSFSSVTSNIIKELILQGYLVIAPEYRGSTGYGKDFYELIDYGGLETEDCLAARDYMVENCELVDPNRVGIIGWSHGGLNTVWSAFKYPDSYRVAYACVPVSDIVARMGYKSDYYREIFAAPYHIGKTACARAQSDGAQIDEANLRDAVRLMQFSREEVLSAVEQLTEEKLNACPIPKKRTVRQDITHIVNAEEWYISRLGPKYQKVYEDNLSTIKGISKSSAVERLRLTRGAIIPTLEAALRDGRQGPFTRSAYTRYPEEQWTLRKVLRRFLEHEREHLGTIKTVLNEPTK